MSIAITVPNDLAQTSLCLSARTEHMAITQRLPFNIDDSPVDSQRQKFRVIDMAATLDYSISLCTACISAGPHDARQDE